MFLLLFEHQRAVRRSEGGLQAVLAFLPVFLPLAFCNLDVVGRGLHRVLGFLRRINFAFQLLLWTVLLLLLFPGAPKLVLGPSCEVLVAEDLVNGGSVLGSGLQNPQNQVLGERGDVDVLDFEVDFLLNDISINLKNTLAAKGGLLEVHLVEQYPETPHVDPLVIKLVLVNLGRDVLVGPAEGIPLGLLADRCGPAEIANLGVESLIQQNILGLNIAVHEPPVVDFLHPQADLPKAVSDPKVLRLV